MANAMQRLPSQSKGKDTAPRNAGITRDWTTGSMVRNLLLLSWPMIVVEVLYAAGQIIDMIWIGRLGSHAVAGVGVASLVLMLIMSMDYGLIVGVRAMVARYVGAHDLAEANRIAGHAFIVCIVWGAFITLVGVFFAEPIIKAFGVAPEVVSEAVAYLRTMCAGWIPMEVLVMSLYVIQSSGDTVTPMKMELLIRSVHIALCPFVVLGLWVFPRLGVTGAALSNVVSQVLGAVVGLWILFGGHTRISLSMRNFHFAPGIVWRILKIGVPALIMMLQRSLGDLALGWLMVPFGTIAVAAHSLASRVDMFLFMPGMALGAGAGVLVGQNLGAGRPDRAERSAWLGVWFVEALMVACAAALLLWAEYVMGIFTAEADLVRLGSIFLRIASASYLVLAFVSVLQSCIAGAGDTVPNMIISIGMIWVVQLPLAYLLPRLTGLGVLGVRWAVVVSVFAGTIAYVLYFVLGRWKTKKV
jgi:putative MATE family efflux protein